jgi:uncharacterized protein YuzE
MRIEYDPKAGLMYIRFNSRPVAKNRIVADDVVVDLDAQDHLIGIEVLNVDLVADAPRELIYEIMQSEPTDGGSVGS